MSRKIVPDRSVIRRVRAAAIRLLRGRRSAQTTVQDAAYTAAAASST